MLDEIEDRLVPQLKRDVTRRVIEEVRKPQGSPRVAHVRAVGALRLLGRQLTTRTDKWRIGVFGTTSSGKTTLVNSLAGHPVLPTDADELSAGVVMIRSATGGGWLRVAGDDGTRNSGAYRCHDLGEVRNRLNSILFLYKDLCRSGDLCAPPLIEIELDLGNAERCLKLSRYHKRVVIDLPGMRILEDRRNLPLLRIAAKECLPIVVVDYTALEAREQLSAVLDLLRQENRFVNRGVAPIVVLNKVDRRLSRDRPLAEVRAEVQRVCNDTLPEVHDQPIGVSTLLLIRALVLGNAIHERVFASPSENGDAESLYRAIDALFCDGEDALFRSRSVDRHSRRRLRHVMSASEDRQALLLDDTLFLFHAAMTASGGRDLASALQRRLDEIEPILCEPNLEDEVAELLADVSSSVDVSTPSLMRRVQVVSRLFQMVIEADRVVRPEEVQLSRSLLGDYASSYARQLDLPQGKLDELIHRELTLVDLPGLLSELPHCDFSGEQLTWIINALKCLCAVDRDVDSRERHVVTLLESARSNARAGNIERRED